MERLAEILVAVATAYAAAGALFAVAFVTFGVERIDSTARGASLGFRLLLVPGSAALWPWLLVRWQRGAPPPEEQNAHRRAERAGGRS